MGGFGMAAKLLLTGSVITKFLDMLREPVERFLAKNVNEILQKNGDAIISNLVGSETDKLLAKPVKNLLAGQDEKLADAVNTMISIYKTIITEHLPNILESVNISAIVRERINEMDMDETEKLILQVMNKELRAIVASDEQGTSGHCVAWRAAWNTHGMREHLLVIGKNIPNSDII